MRAEQARLRSRGWGSLWPGSTARPTPGGRSSKRRLFIGGGNTFRLVKALQDPPLLEPIRRRVAEEPYIGRAPGLSFLPTIRTNQRHADRRAFLLRGPLARFFQINAHYLIWTPRPRTWARREKRAPPTARGMRDARRRPAGEPCCGSRGTLCGSGKCAGADLPPRTGTRSSARLPRRPRRYVKPAGTRL
jgi:hypothetical protein